jgi:ATP-dependent Clp protease protease subunit
MPKFWDFKEIKNQAGQDEIELRIDGEIVDDDWAWIYQWFGITSTSPNAFRKKLEEYKGKNITVWINSPGGDVFAGAGIYIALKEHKGKKTVKIDGKAMSAASVIAMAGDEIMMTPVSIMMIHNPWTEARGEAKDMRHAADVLDVVKGTIINAYQMKTKRSRDEISKLMDDETWMDSNSAVAEKFADGIMYQDQLPDEGAKNILKNAFMFGRLSIQNKASESMKGFLEKYHDQIAGKNPDVTPPEPDKPAQDSLLDKPPITNKGRALSAANEEKIRNARDYLNDVLSQLDEGGDGQDKGDSETQDKPTEETPPKDTRQLPVDLDRYNKRVKNAERRLKTC